MKRQPIRVSRSLTDSRRAADRGSDERGLNVIDLLLGPRLEADRRNVESHTVEHRPLRETGCPEHGRRIAYPSLLQTGDAAESGLPCRRAASSNLHDGKRPALASDDVELERAHPHVAVEHLAAQCHEVSRHQVFSLTPVLVTLRQCQEPKDGAVAPSQTWGDYFAWPWQFASLPEYPWTVPQLALSEAYFVSCLMQ